MTAQTGVVVEVRTCREFVILELRGETVWLTSRDADQIAQELWATTRGLAMAAWDEPTVVSEVRP